MNDRFKFRVWSKQSNSYIKEKMFYIDRFGGLFKYEKSKSTVYINAPSPYVMCLCGDNYIVEKCTGLKDKNGKLIYEGDILKSTYSEIMQYLIYWEGRGYRMRVYGSDNKIVDDCPIFINAADVLEVIGNIHENADLLENEE